MVFLFDFDEVFVDINTGALAYINNKLGSNYVMDDLSSWDFFDKPEVKGPFFEYLSLPDIYQNHAIPNNEMINVFKQVIEMGYPAYIVTASVESSEKSKYQFIKENMKFFNTKNLFTVNNSSKYKMKSDVLNELNLNYHEPIVLVDDGIHNVLDMMADIKHKDMLDDIMKQFYLSRRLKKFNNPYHEFIYGVIPELVYNKEIEDGKRIFKIKEAKEMWSVIEKITKQHKARVENKQAEIFNYINNVLDGLVEPNQFKAIVEAQSNVSFLVKNLLNKNNKHAQFLSDIAKLSVKVEAILNGQGFDELDVFGSSDKKFGSDIMYNEIKSLAKNHSCKNLPVEQVEEAQKIGKIYGINEDQKDLFNISFLEKIITVSKENLLVSHKIASNFEVLDVKTKQKLLKALKDSGVTDENNFEWAPVSEIFANVSLALNKNFVLDNGVVSFKNNDLEKVRESVLNGINKPKNKKI